MENNIKISEKAFMQMIAHVLNIFEGEDVYATLKEKAKKIYADYSADPDMGLEKAYVAFTNTKEGKIDLDAFMPMFAQIIEDASGLHPQIDDDGTFKVDELNIDANAVYLNNFAAHSPSIISDLGGVSRTFFIKESQSMQASLHLFV